MEAIYIILTLAIIRYSIVSIALYRKRVREIEVNRRLEEQKRLEAERKAAKEIEVNKQLEEQKRLEAEREAIKKLEVNELIGSLHDKIEKGLLAYNSLIQSDKYISNYDKYQFISTYANLFDTLKHIQIEKYAYARPIKKYATDFLNNYKNIDLGVTKKNTLFVKAELESQDQILSNIEGKSLDEQQRNAIIVDEDNSLVIAGAGSGKTLTIAGKVKYLTERYSINPQEILLISFTSKAVEEMRERIKNKMHIDVSVKTFHKLGLDIISEANLERPSIFGLSHKETLELFASFIDNARNDDMYFSNLTNFLSYYTSIPQKKENDNVNFESLRIKDNLDKSYKISEKYKTTLKLVEKIKHGSKVKYREKVKSYEELLIANFLFRNRIKYAYEERYQFNTASKKFAQYKPDFYLPDYNIYIEHFGIDKNGNVPPWFKGTENLSAKAKYNEGIQWKKNEHQARGTTLVETYSWENSEGILLSSLKDKLNNLGVLFAPMTDNEIWDYLSTHCPHEVDNFTTLVYTFLSLVKSNNKSITALKAMSINDPRASAFINLFSPIYQQYNEYLSENEEIDFNDMINMATTQVNKKDFESPYKYIIIDEFQDISSSRYQLIMAFLNKCSSTKLFCVGDDWQSIYRFAGSDLGLFVKFENYFEDCSIAEYKRKTHKFLIENTYRFDNQLIDLSSNFIMQNPNQISKNLISLRQSNEPAFTVLDYDYNNRIIDPLHLALDSIASKAQGQKVSIKLLGRYTHEIDAVRTSRLTLKYNGKKGDEIITDPNNNNFTISFNTVHSAKGLEADYVIILNGNSGKHGFPTEVTDDPLLNFLLSSADQFPHGEERRLFYVALTRAKKHVYILSNSESRSKFVKEITHIENPDLPICDWCGSQLIERKSHFKSEYYYSCCNFHVCNFSRKISFEEIYDKANNLLKNKNYKDALVIYNQAIEKNSRSYMAYYERGYCYTNLGKKSEAKNDYSISISINQSFARAYYWRGGVNYDLGDYVSSANDWKKAYSLDSKDTSAYFWYLKSIYMLAYYNLVLLLLEKYLQLKPSDKDGYLLRAECLVKKEKFKDAYKELLSAKKLGQDIDNYLSIYNLSTNSQNRYEVFKIESNSSKAIYDAIKGAIDNKYIIQFNYQKSTTFSNGEQSKRMVKPIEFEVIETYGSMCLKGFCFLMNENRLFTIEQISNLEILK